VQQLLVRAQDRQPRHAEVRRETSGGRDSLARAQSAVENGVPQSVIDLPEDRNAGASVEWKVQHEREAVKESGYAKTMQNGDGESTARPNIGRVDANGW
jgi:hypothetical protein